MIDLDPTTQTELLGTNTVRNMFPRLAWYDCLTIWRHAGKTLVEAGHFHPKTYDVYDAIVRSYNAFDFDSPINTSKALGDQ